MVRRRSIRKDKADMEKFRWSRDRYLGVSISTEWYQTVPLFFTRDRCPLWLTGQYRGASAFLVCNGPSLASENFDLSLLKLPGVITYGMNNGPRTIRPNFWSCVDDPKRFLKSIWLDPLITKFVPHAHAEKPIFDSETWTEVRFEDGQHVLVGDCPNVIYFHRNEKFMPDRFLFEDTYNWGDHSKVGPDGFKGGRTVMLPCLRILFILGFRRVYLLGADFSMSEDYAYHFDEQREKGAVNCNNNTYEKMKQIYFPGLKPYFDAEGFEVFNCNPDSKLEAFPFIDYHEAIRDCMEPLGDWQNERTWGMYRDPKKPNKTRQEISDAEKPHLANIRKDGGPVFGGENVPSDLVAKNKEQKTNKIDQTPSCDNPENISVIKLTPDDFMMPKKDDEKALALSEVTPKTEKQDEHVDAVCSDLKEVEHTLENQFGSTEWQTGSPHVVKVHEVPDTSAPPIVDPERIIGETEDDNRASKGDNVGDKEKSKKISNLPCGFPS